jgi:hypothetical protein
MPFIAILWILFSTKYYLEYMYASPGKGRPFRKDDYFVRWHRKLTASRSKCARIEWASSILPVPPWNKLGATLIKIIDS